MIPSNYHTHTVFCDGKDTPAQMAERACSLGCPALGFSGHCFTSYDLQTGMSPQQTEQYKEQVRQLKEAYRGKMEIYLGVEQDSFGDHAPEGYEYIIGSVHALRKNGSFLFVDYSAEVQKRYVHDRYDGDFYAFCEDYYEEESHVYEKTGCDVIGHFDLITKFNENGELFDTSHPRYREAAERALEKLLKTPCIFEMNYGAIARGYRKTPYPEPWLLDKIRKAGKRILPTSDCHDREKLLLGLPQDADYSYFK